MKRFPTLLLMCVFMNIVNASAQTVVMPPSDDPGRDVTVYKSHEFTLTNISSIRVVNQRLNGTALPAPRYQLRGIYTPAFNCPTPKICPAVMPESKPATVILREWEFAADGIQDRMLNVCRRTIENARRRSVLTLKGKVTYDKAASTVYLQSITSCVVQYTGG